jgi:murein DD-endopeptidase MepM/ murein hydrolase activator NlpD
MASNECSPATIRISIADMLALKVRSQGSDASDLPESLYQRLPAKAMGLMATLPQGDIHVSISSRSAPGADYSIEKIFPSNVEGFVMVYALQANRRYEAVEIAYQGENFGIAQFINISNQWVAAHQENSIGATGCYRYLSPTAEQWGVIRRDSGYVAVDPAETTPLPKQDKTEQLASGVCIRMPVPSALPTFSRVELALDPNPDDRSRWLSFDAYLGERALKSHPPKTMIPCFRDWEERLMRECGLEAWIFSQGMFFLDRIEWWGSKNRRRTEHEGIDFALGKSTDARIMPMPPTTPVRAIADGEAVATLDDFLGRTVLVRHPTIMNEESAVFYTLYSHIQPKDGLSGQVSKGQILGRIGEPKSSNTPMHLHLTAAWIPPSIRPEQITMNHINHAFAPIVLVDFFKSLGC